MNKKRILEIARQKAEDGTLPSYLLHFKIQGNQEALDLIAKDKKIIEIQKKVNVEKQKRIRKEAEEIEVGSTFLRNFATRGNREKMKTPKKIRRKRRH